MGGHSSQFQGFGGSEMIEGIEASDVCPAFDVECFCGPDRRQTVSPDDDTLIVLDVRWVQASVIAFSSA